jgi:hypothetical protein
MIRLRLIALVVMAFLLPTIASAELGGDVSSVQRDRAQMKASLKIQQTSRYAIHEMTADSGTSVREYASPEGKVFAVTWQGQFNPDFQQLLGTYFSQLEKATQQQRRARRAPVVLEQSGFVFQSYGHFRALAGRAYVKDLVPQGVELGEIK